MLFLMIVALVIVVLAAVFAIQNAEPVTVQFLFWQTQEISLALVLLLTFIAGVVVSLLVTLPGMIRRERRIASQKKKLADVEKLVAKGEERQEPPS